VHSLHAHIQINSPRYVSWTVECSLQIWKRSVGKCGNVYPDRHTHTHRNSPIYSKITYIQNLVFKTVCCVQTEGNQTWTKHQLNIYMLQDNLTFWDHQENMEHIRISVYINYSLYSIHVVYNAKIQTNCTNTVMVVMWWYAYKGILEATSFVL
jgi:hypothetical protein